MFAMRHIASYDLALACATGTILAAIRQADTGANCRCEDSFPFVTGELMAARLDSYLESHTISTMNKNAIKNKIKKLNKPRLLIVGCGDVGMRLLPLACRHFRVFAVTSQAARCGELRAAGAIPIVADLDQPGSLARLAPLANRVVHLTPPRSEGIHDRRTRNLTAILPDHATLVYISTTGVYGDCSGALIDETRTVHPVNARAKRRIDAEQTLRAWAKRAHGRLSILRVPGIYAADRLPLERLKQGTPALIAGEDVITNHIHADDLAKIILTALFRAAPCRVYHAVDDTTMYMGEYFDAVADAFRLPRPPRLTRHALQQTVSPMLLSFMSESRRLSNQRMKAELGVQLCFPSVKEGLMHIVQATADSAQNHLYEAATS
jgi:nucleoside-diphosphate-sugar epimerase